MTQSSEMNELFSQRKGQILVILNQVNKLGFKIVNSWSKSTEIGINFELKIKPVFSNTVSTAGQNIAFFTCNAHIVLIFTGKTIFTAYKTLSVLWDLILHTDWIAMVGFHNIRLYVEPTFTFRAYLRAFALLTVIDWAFNTLWTIVWNVIPCTALQTIRISALTAVVYLDQAFITF